MRPRTFHATEHDIDHTQIDSDALHVIDQLTAAGFTAYLVGGSVRDLLVKRIPKDYDISTSARPEEIKQIFRRNCILIGKRFRLAHIRFGHNIIEVSTFRSGENESDLIIRDNTWGTEEEDVIRRDFTINGLFYDPIKHEVIDYVQGWEDIHKGILRTIGDPMIRFKQDPVRMIRLLKFRARFGFEIEEKTKEALLKCIDQIIRSSPARILEEMLRMLESGASAQFFHLMTKAGILQLIFPHFSEYLEGEKGEKIYELMEIADQVNLNNRQQPLDRSILASCLLFPIVEAEILKRSETGEIPLNLGDIMMIISSNVKDVVTASFSQFPRKISSTMVGIMTTQFRLTPLSGKIQFRSKLLRSKEFDISLKFLKLRAVANKDLMDAYNRWNNMHRQFLKEGSHKGHHPHPPPRRRRRS